MAEPTVEITIINDSRREQCNAQCGVDWSSAEAIALARQRIRERFGQQARLDYIDLAKTAASQRVLDLRERIKDLPLPSLLINGHSRVSGEFDMRQLLDAIEAEMEIEA